RAQAGSREGDRSAGPCRRPLFLSAARAVLHVHLFPDPGHRYVRAVVRPDRAAEQGVDCQHHVFQLRDDDDRGVRRSHPPGERPADVRGHRSAHGTALPGERRRARRQPSRSGAAYVARRRSGRGGRGVTRERISTAAELGLMTGPPPFPAERLVTLANWQDPPFNRWGFQHIAELIPTARIARGGPVWRLPEEPRDLSGTRIDADGRSMPLPSFLERTYTDGIIVLHGGRVVMESYFNGMDKRSRHLLMSV